MSTIVAVRKGNRACIAADSLTSYGDTRQSSKYEVSYDKIHRFGGNYIGIVGSAAHHIVLQSVLKDKLEAYRLDSLTAIFESFRKLHPVLKEKYFLNPKDDDDDPYESTRIDALIANSHGIFGIYSLREVFEYTRFWAIGSGSEIALGAMYATYERLDSIEDIARIAVEASAEFNSSTALPMSLYNLTIESLKDE